MEWYRFTISNRQIASIETQKIQEKFKQLWWPLSCPKGTAVYAKKSENGPSATYYLTPSCKKPAKALMVQYAAEACEQPDKDTLIFIAGDSSFLS